jgi:hypothetical protein
MERLFSPCTRLRDILASEGCPGPHNHLKELNLDVSTEEFLRAERAFTYTDLYAMLGNVDTVAWLTPDAAVTRVTAISGNYSSAERSWKPLDGSCWISFYVDGRRILAMARSPGHLLEICDVVLPLLAASVVYSVRLSNGDSYSRRAAFINAPILANLMEQCQSLEALKLTGLELDESHCRVLGAYSRPDLEIKLEWCAITGPGASALAEVLGRNQGPAELVDCDVDYSVFVNALRRNSRLKKILRTNRCSREVVAIADALRQNKGLVELELWHDTGISDEAWDAVCDSLKTHPTLEVLHLIGVGEESRTQDLVDMIKVNTSIHTLIGDLVCGDEHCIPHPVIPYLATNRHRPRVRAIQKTRPIAYRAKVLGRSLLAVRTDPNRFWMLLSGNPEVAFPTRTPTIAAAANLHMPATTSTSALTTTVTGILPAATAAAAARAAIPSSTSDAVASTPTVPAAAANVATPSAGQKRKARS